MPKKELEKDPRAFFEVKIKEQDIGKEFQKFLEDDKHQKYRPGEKFAYKSVQDWLDNWYGYVYSPEHKAYGYYHNPNAKWDWYLMGGRWKGFFKLKKDKKGVLGESGAFDNKADFDADQALKRDIDWEFMKQNSEKTAIKNWEEMQKRTDLDEPGKYWDHDYKKGETEEHYIERQSSAFTFAVVKNGIWYEKGVMGWWGIVSDEISFDEWQKEWKKLIMSLPEDTLLTLVDCHI